MDFQIVIPMTGHGSRFSAAGYERLKPFIRVHGRPIIEWVTRMFAPSDDFLLVGRSEHYDSLPYYGEEIQKLGLIDHLYLIDDWVKQGPVADVMRAWDRLDGDRPIIICYCDFYMQWDYLQFKSEVLNRGVDGSVPCYSGFHPHLLLHENVYASCKVDKADNLIEIREKFSWEEDKMQSRHSPGVYYFKDRETLGNSCRALVEAGDSINGEFYASLPYNYLVKEGGTVWCPSNVDRFCQWGTPKDLQEYLFWVEGLFETSK